MNIYYDGEGDFLEVMFEHSEKPGYMHETENDAVMEYVDEEGNIMGFQIMSVTKLAKEKPISVDLGRFHRIDPKIRSMMGILPPDTDVDALRMEYLTEKHLRGHKE